MKRRTAISLLTTGIAGITLSGKLFAAENKEAALKGNINHSVCSWTYNFLGLDVLCATLKKMKVGAIDLLAPKDWPIAKKYGLTCSMCYTAGKISLTEGWNNTKNHQWLIKDFTEAIPLVAQQDIKILSALVATETEWMMRPG